MIYPAHEGFIAPARERPQIWRLIVGLIVAMVIYVVIMAVILAVAIYLSVPPGFWSSYVGWIEQGAVGPDPLQREVIALLSGARPTQVLVILSTFGGMFLGAMAAARWLHGRPFGTLTGPFPTLTRHFGQAALVTFPILALTVFLPPFIETAPNLEISVWLTFLPMAILMILLQTGAEELLFRGYLQQQLAARFRSPIIWMVMPSVLFGLGHFSTEQYGSAAWLVVGVTTLIGLLAADLTARTGSIGAAWGFHFANNMAAILIVSLEGPLAGLSLWVIPAANLPESTFQIAILRDVVVILVIWAVIRRALRP